MLYEYQDEPSVVTVWTDGDWSGKRADVQIHVPGCDAERCPHGQDVEREPDGRVSLSTAESEFYAIGRGTSSGLTVKHVLQVVADTLKLGAKIRMVVWTHGQVHVAQGLRHLVTRYQWYQEVLRSTVRGLRVRFEGQPR